MDEDDLLTPYKEETFEQYEQRSLDCSMWVSDNSLDDIINAAVASRNDTPKPEQAVPAAIDVPVEKQQPEMVAETPSTVEPVQADPKPPVEKIEEPDTVAKDVVIPTTSDEVVVKIEEAAAPKKKRGGGPGRPPKKRRKCPWVLGRPRKPKPEPPENIATEGAENGHEQSTNMDSTTQSHVKTEPSSGEPTPKRPRGRRRQSEEIALLRKQLEDINALIPDGTKRKTRPSRLLDDYDTFAAEMKRPPGRPPGPNRITRPHDPLGEKRRRGRPRVRPAKIRYLFPDGTAKPGRPPRDPSTFGLLPFIKDEDGKLVQVDPPPPPPEGETSTAIGRPPKMVKVKKVKIRYLFPDGTAKPGRPPRDPSTFGLLPFIKDASGKLVQVDPPPKPEVSPRMVKVKIPRVKNRPGRPRTNPPKFRFLYPDGTPLRPGRPPRNFAKLGILPFIKNDRGEYVPLARFASDLCSSTSQPQKTDNAETKSNADEMKKEVETTQAGEQYPNKSFEEDPSMFLSMKMETGDDGKNIRPLFSAQATSTPLGAPEKRRPGRPRIHPPKPPRIVKRQARDGKKLGRPKKSDQSAQGEGEETATGNSMWRIKVGSLFKKLSGSKAAGLKALDGKKRLYRRKEATAVKSMVEKQERPINGLQPRANFTTMYGNHQFAQNMADPLGLPPLNFMDPTTDHAFEPIVAEPNRFNGLSSHPADNSPSKSVKSPLIIETLGLLPTKNLMGIKPTSNPKFNSNSTITSKTMSPHPVPSQPDANLMKANVPAKMPRIKVVQPDKLKAPPSAAMPPLHKYKNFSSPPLKTNFQQFNSNLRPPKLHAIAAVRRNDDSDDDCVIVSSDLPTSTTNSSSSPLVCKVNSKTEAAQFFHNRTPTANAPPPPALHMQSFV